ncbi:prephenate dehydrogenase/arogenate dehydrogenase family protein [Candidatus Saganbacteria bacterium]|nr:prephenate dehydrogenase/arogenate dehydrogenase family protein [Candidatus Saganbacteria bacterium]
MKKIAIVGLGLIGGSLAKAFKREGFYVIGIPHRQETLDKAEQVGAIDEGSLDLKSVSDADFIFICTPINQIIPTLKLFAVSCKPGAIVTDVASTKQEIVSQAEKLVPKGTFFVGGHPMAGKEKVKFEESDADIFSGKTYILTQTSKTSKKALEALKDIVTQLHSTIVTFDPKTHDLVVAGISHVPLAVSVALVNSVMNSEQKDNMKQTASSGFRDTTRVASGDPELGVNMFTTNKKAVLKTLKEFKKALSNIEKLIKTGDSSGLKAELERAKSFRDSIYG